MHQASNMHNIIKIDVWAEPNVNFIYRETTPFIKLPRMSAYGSIDR